MSLINPSYFVGELDIPNLKSTSGNNEARLNEFIEKYEPRFLALLLGETLYASYKAGLLETPVGAKWKALRDFEGLKNAIACYVYYYYMIDAATKTTSAGEMIPSVENGKIANNHLKLFRRCNEIREFARRWVQFLDTNVAQYPGWSLHYRLFLYSALPDANPVL